jgi:aryl-alcohol dehydrogenase-like predicted oxidoreductase
LVVLCVFVFWWQCFFTHGGAHKPNTITQPQPKHPPTPKNNNQKIHWPDRYVPLFGAAPYDAALARADAVPFDEQLRALQDVVAAGKVRYVGVSNETSYGVTEFMRATERAGGALPRVQTIQNVYHLMQRSTYETDLAETCHAHNVSLLAYSPLAGGALSGNFTAGVWGACLFG